MTFVEFAEKMYGSELSDFQIEQLSRYEEMINQGYEIVMPPPRIAKSCNLDLILLINEFKREVQNVDISEQINDKAEVIAKLLSRGQHVELCENKDGLRIVAIDRKVVK